MNGTMPNQVMVDAKSLQTLSCQCGQFVFEQVVMYKIVPVIYSNNGKPGLFPIPCIKCLACGQTYIIEEVIRGVAENPQVKEESLIEVVKS